MLLRCSLGWFVLRMPSPCACARVCVCSGPGAEQEMLTKGDNNIADDRGLYAQNQLYLKRSDLLGRARGYAPSPPFLRCSLILLPPPLPSRSVVRYVGMATILMNDYPWFKYILLGGMGLFVLTSNE